MEQLVVDYGIVWESDLVSLICCDDFDVIVIVILYYCYCEEVLLAVFMGKYVLIEKLLVMLVEDCDSMVVVFVKFGLVFSVGYY